jgi:hypothetical protein
MFKKKIIWKTTKTKIIGKIIKNKITPKAKEKRKK